MSQLTAPEDPAPSADATGARSGAILAATAGTWIGTLPVWLVSSAIAQIIPGNATVWRSIMMWLWSGMLLPLGLAAALLVGMPLHLLLASAKLRGAAAYALSGGAVGAVCFTTLTELMGFTELAVAPAPELALYLLFGAGSGSGAALCFWLVLRPDRRPTSASAG